MRFIKSLMVDVLMIHHPLNGGGCACGSQYPCPERTQVLTEWPEAGLNQ